MKRFYLLAALMLLSPSAHAGDSISFVVGGHRIHIEASRYCRSTSCASISISGIHEQRRKRDRLDDDDVAPVKAVPAPLPISPPPTPNTAPAQTIIAASPPPAYKPTAAVAAAAATPSAPIQQAAIPLPPPPPPLPPVNSAEAARPAPVDAPQVARISHEVGDDADSPIGDWQTESKGLVRIGRCGKALCGYMLNPSSNDKGEAILINMKPKTDRQWIGNVYSHDSGDTYYGTMAIKGPGTLRVEACALGRFYCSGADWSRIADQPQRLMTSRQVDAAPRS